MSSCGDHKTCFALPSWLLIGRKRASTSCARMALQSWMPLPIRRCHSVSHALQDQHLGILSRCPAGQWLLVPSVFLLVGAMQQASKHARSQQQDGPQLCRAPVWVLDHLVPGIPSLNLHEIVLSMLWNLGFARKPLFPERLLNRETVQKGPSAHSSNWKPASHSKAVQPNPMPPLLSTPLRISERVVVDTGFAVVCPTLPCNHSLTGGGVTQTARNAASLEAFGTSFSVLVRFRGRVTSALAPRYLHPTDQLTAVDWQLVIASAGHTRPEDPTKLLAAFLIPSVMHLTRWLLVYSMDLPRPPAPGPMSGEDSQIAQEASQVNPSEVSENSGKP